MNQIAGRDDRRQSRHQERDACPAHDTVETEQAGNQACRDRGADGEEVDKITRKRIDRRPKNDRRLFRGSGRTSRN